MLHETPQVDLLATSWTHAGDVRPGRGLETSPIPILDRVEMVAAAGFRGIGFGWPDLESAVGSIGLATLRDGLTAAGIVHVEVEFLNDWWIDGPRRERSDAVRTGLLTAAAALGARHIKVGCGDFGDSRDHGRLRRELVLLADQAADHGTRLALEPGAGSALDLTGEALPLLESVAHPAAGLMLDPWHLVRAGLPYAQTLRAIPGELVFGVELSDGSPEQIGTLMDDTFDRRMPPGTGGFDVAEFAGEIQALGFSGPWGVEVMSTATRRQDPRTTLADCASAVRSVLSNAGRPAAR